MATRNDLSVFAGDGATVFTWQILSGGSPFNLGGSTVQIVTKGSSSLPDPTSGSNVYLVSNGGLAITNASQGQGTWTLPAAYASQPSVTWWHGIYTTGGVVTTWGYGQLTVAAV